MVESQMMTNCLFVLWSLICLLLSDVIQKNFKKILITYAYLPKGPVAGGMCTPYAPLYSPLQLFDKFW